MLIDSPLFRWMNQTGKVKTVIGKSIVLCWFIHCRWNIQPPPHTKQFSKFPKSVASSQAAAYVQGRAKKCGKWFKQPAAFIVWFPESKRHPTTVTMTHGDPIPSRFRAIPNIQMADEDLPPALSLPQECEVWSVKSCVWSGECEA